MTREELNQEKQQEIFDEERHEKRKKITILVFKTMFVIIVCFLAFYLYTSFISTKILTIKEERIVNNKLPDNFNGLKVIHFSDFHYGTTMFEGDLMKIINEINKRKPDLVLFTGDLVDESYKISTEEQEKIIQHLQKINSTLGKYAVSGEEDDKTFVTIMKQSDFEILNNSYDLIYKDDATPILLIGIDSLINKNADINQAFSYFKEATHNSNIFSITLAHEPDLIDVILSDYSTDIFLAGHSHNGTVRIPFVGGIYKEIGAEKYDDEYYRIYNTDMFVSGGLGTNGPGFRLFCRPSINFFRISNR